MRMSASYRALMRASGPWPGPPADRRTAFGGAGAGNSTPSGPQTDPFNAARSRAAEAGGIRARTRVPSAMGSCSISRPSE